MRTVFDLVRFEEFQRFDKLGFEVNIKNLLKANFVKPFFHKEALFVVVDY